MLIIPVPFASGAGGRRIATRPRHTEGVIILPVATLFGAQHYNVTKTRPCNILQFLTAVKKIIFR